MPKKKKLDTLVVDDFMFSRLNLSKGFKDIILLFTPHFMWASIILDGQHQISKLLRKF